MVQYIIKAHVWVARRQSFPLRKRHSHPGTQDDAEEGRKDIGGGGREWR